MINIIEVTTNKALNTFIEIPWGIYKDDPNWVPPLLRDTKKLLRFKNNPYNKTSEFSMFIAYKNKLPVGRIAVFKHGPHLDKYKDGVGFFGYFETIDDSDVSKALFKIASDWVLSKNMRTLRGPINMSLNEECGLLIDGFDTPPRIKMLHNPAYYIKHIENYGFEKAHDLYAYLGLPSDKKLVKNFTRLKKMIPNNKNIVISQLSMKDIEKEIDEFKQVFDETLSENWGSTPIEIDELKKAFLEMKPIIDPSLILKAHYKNEPAGIILALPDFNEILKKINGRLFPFGIFTFLYNLKKIKGTRLLFFGVKKELRHHQIGLSLMIAYLENGLIKNGYNSVELSWILESNKTVGGLLSVLSRNTNMNIYKTYRIYDKVL